MALVGFPSAGKSSLIAAMSSAKPKIADYPFTTLVPNLGVVVAGDMRYTIADVPGLIPGASQGKGLGLEFLRHIERTEIIAHVIDCATLEPGRDPMSDYQALEHELAEYAGKLELPLGAIPIPERPRIIILNKVDVPEAKELAEFVKPEFEKLGLKVYIISTASHEGLKELNWALADLVTNMRAEVAKREQAEEEARVVIKPLEEPRNRRRRNDEGGNALDFTVERKENGNGEVWYEVLGTKPERWVMQTNFDNDEAVGYLADRLAKLGVEDELRHKGAKPGDEVRIGRGDRAVEFDWDPTIAAGAEMLDGTQLGARGVDLRLQESDGRAQRRSNTERRRQYHEMMDARQGVREAMMAERKKPADVPMACRRAFSIAGNGTGRNYEHAIASASAQGHRRSADHRGEGGLQLADRAERPLGSATVERACGGHRPRAIDGRPRGAGLLRRDRGRFRHARFRQASDRRS